MNLTTLLLFIPACFALNMAPGPNNLLSLTNAERYGVQHTFHSRLSIQDVSHWQKTT